ncbi:MAG: hypothetical protein C0483_19370 [Pirellula sp.]|nr:hypothetical protein [Pirellula sp.]
MIRHLVIGLLSLVCVVALSLDSEAFARRCCKPARGCAKKSCCSTGCATNACATNACAAGGCVAATGTAPAVAAAPAPAPTADKTAAAADQASDGTAAPTTVAQTRARRFGNGTIRAAASNLMVRR